MSDKAKKILLVDDDPDFLEQISLILKADNYEVITAQNQAEGEEALLRGKPDLSILDLMMENMDSGFILAHYLKKIYPTAPIILLTGVNASTGINFTAEKPDEKGWVKVDKIMDKPVRADQLKAEIRKLLNEENTAVGHGSHH